MSKRLNADKIVNKVIPVDLIDAHKDNYNQHPEEQISQLAASHAEFGQYRSVVVVARPGGRYVQVAGHGYLQAAKGEGLTQVRADVLPEDTPAETIKAIMIADNEHAKNSSADDELLAQLLQEQANAGFDLAALGTDEEALRQMLDALTPASGDEWANALGDLPDGDKSPFQQMTFTLSNEQADLVKEALDLALEDKDNFEDMGNQNSNGNALAYVVKFFLEMGKVDE